MTSIFVAKLDFGIGNEELRQAFARYGTVLKATVATDRETGKSRGFGFVEMANEDEAKQAISALDGSLLNGRPIAVKEAEQRNDNRGSREPFNRDTNRAPRENQPRSERPSREDVNRSPIGEAPQPFVAPFDAVKSEPKRKKDDKKSKSWDEEKGAKKPKMNAYKKSNKHTRFFDDDEEDDFELDQFNSFYSANDDDFDESDDDFEDED